MASLTFGDSFFENGDITAFSTVRSNDADGAGEMPFSGSLQLSASTFSVYDIYESYGKGKVDAICAGRGYDLANLQGNDFIKMMLEVSELNVNDVVRLFRNAKLIDCLGASVLKMEEGEGSSGGIDDPQLRRLHDERADLFRVLADADSINDLEAKDLQAVIEFLRPIKNVPLALGIERRDEITAEPPTFWSRIAHDYELFGMLPGKTTMANQRAQLCQQIKDLENLTEKTPQQHWEAYLEILAKECAYKEFPEGAIIPAPPSSTQGSPRFYKVMKQCAAGAGMVAYILTRATSDMNDLPPLIMFRGSVFYPAGLDALSTCVTDLEPNLAEMAFERGKEQLFTELSKEGLLSADEQQLQIVGHSLGGTLAERFACEYAQRRLTESLPSEELNNLQAIKMNIFNSPGVGNKKANEFKEAMSQLNDFTVEGTLYKTKGDIVDLAGGAHIGYGCARENTPFTVVLFEDVDVRFNFTYFHIVNFLNQPDHSSRKEIGRITEGLALEVELGNATIKAYLTEFMRLTIGLLTYLLLLAPYLLIRCLFGWRGNNLAQAEDLGRLQSQFKTDITQLTHLLIDAVEPEDAVLEGQSWLRDRIKNFLDNCLMNIRDGEEKRIVLEELFDQMQSLAPSLVLNEILFNAADLKLKTDLEECDFPLLAEAYARAVNDVFHEMLHE